MNPQDQQPNGQSDAGRPDWQQGLVPQPPTPVSQPNPVGANPVIQTISPTNQINPEPQPEPQIIAPQNPEPLVAASATIEQPAPTPATPAVFQPAAQPSVSQGPDIAAPNQPLPTGNVVAPPPQLADIQAQNYQQSLEEESSSNSIKPMLIGLGIALVIIVILAAVLLI